MYLTQEENQLLEEFDFNPLTCVQEITKLRQSLSEEHEKLQKANEKVESFGDEIDALEGDIRDLKEENERLMPRTV